jgi:hypothetical protein
MEFARHSWEIFVIKNGKEREHLNVDLIGGYN